MSKLKANIIKMKLLNTSLFAFFIWKNSHENANDTYYDYLNIKHLQKPQFTVKCEKNEKRKSFIVCTMAQKYTHRMLDSVWMDEWMNEWNNSETKCME